MLAAEEAEHDQHAEPRRWGPRRRRADRRERASGTRSRGPARRRGDRPGRPADHEATAPTCATCRARPSTRSCWTPRRPTGSRPRSRRSPRGCATARPCSCTCTRARWSSRSCWPSERHAASRPRAPRRRGPARAGRGDPRARRRSGALDPHERRERRPRCRSAALLVCPCTPPGGGDRRTRLRPAPAASDAPPRTSGRARQPAPQRRDPRRAARRSGLRAAPLDGGEVLDLLHARFDPARQRSASAPPSFTAPRRDRRRRTRGEDAEHGGARARALARAICTAPIELSTRPGTCRSADSLEQVLHLSLAPEQTWLGWLTAHDARRRGRSRSACTSRRPSATASGSRRSAATSGCSASTAASSSADGRSTPTRDCAEEEAARADRPSSHRARRRHLPR